MQTCFLFPRIMKNKLKHLLNYVEVTGANVTQKRHFGVAIKNLVSKRDYYDLLGIKSTATAQEIKLAYFQLAKKYHPDANPNNVEAAQKFQEVAEAFEVLSDNAKRSSYDSFGMDGRGFKNSDKTKHKRSTYEDFVDEDEEKDYFDRIYKQYEWAFQDAGLEIDPELDREFYATKHGHVPTKEVIVELTFAESVHGTTKKIPLNIIEICGFCLGFGSMFKDGKNTCTNCSGTGKTYYTEQGIPQRGKCPKCNGSKYIIKNLCAECGGKGKLLLRKVFGIPIPAGVADSQTIMIKVQESDVLLILKVEPHKIFKRDGSDVYSDATISISQAVLGGQLKLESIYDVKDHEMEWELGRVKDNHLNLDIVPLTSSHDVLVAPNKGFAVMGTQEFGNHYFDIIIQSPSILTEHQRYLMEEYARLETERIGTVNFKERAQNKVYN